MADKEKKNKTENQDEQAGKSGQPQVEQSDLDARQQQAEEKMKVSEDEQVDENAQGAQERLSKIEEVAPKAADLAAEEMDFSGPLHLQDPRDRVMTGAVNEEHAKEQKKLLKNKPDDSIGDVSEAGFDSEGNVVS